MATLLLAKGADANAKDNRGWTSLHMAADYLHTGHRSESQAVIDLLIANNADVNAKDKYGKTMKDITAENAIKLANDQEELDQLRREKVSETPCAECGSPDFDLMRERGVEFEIFSGFATLDCQNCSKPMQIPLNAIDKSAGVVALCRSCNRGSLVPAAVRCKTCGVGLSIGWQKLVRLR